VQDATDIGHLLETNTDETVNFNVLLKTNVTRKHMLTSLIVDLFSGKNEVALLYFSGHGFFNELGGYLVTPDHQRYDEGISMHDILVLANKSETTHKIIILDCCHSGAMATPALAHGAIGHINEGVTILTASRQDEVAIEVGGKGIFTGLLLDALKGGAADVNGNITPGSIYAFINQALGPWDQTPVFKTNVSRFIALRRVKPRIEVSVMKLITQYFASPEDLHDLDPSYEHTYDPGNTGVVSEKNIETFKVLKKMQNAGLVEPVGEDHMYWAAINGKSCRLTALGAHYWRLVNEKKI
jgi:hypothetical protein